jgi:hypothetical protein
MMILSKSEATFMCRDGISYRKVELNFYEQKNCRAILDEIAAFRAANVMHGQ